MRRARHSSDRASTELSTAALCSAPSRARGAHDRMMEASPTDPADRDSARWLRAIRLARRISQREFAEIAGLPRSTVDRIEAGTTDPRFSTFVRLSEAVGYYLVLMDHRGRMCLLPRPGGRLTDRAGRTLPAHLPFAKVPAYLSGSPWQWWGWHSIAWPFTDDWVPEYTFWKRRPPPRRVWDDAT